MRRFLIDGDILVYRVGFTTEDVEFPLACWRMREMLDGIFHDLEYDPKTDDPCIFLSHTGHKGFRYQLYPEYKAHRKAPKPKWYGDLREYLCDEYGATVSDELNEADDEIGIATASPGIGDYIVITIDKDLDQLTGMHYNFVHRSKYVVAEDYSRYWFYLQLLQGDRTDNITGIPGIGLKKAARILEKVDPIGIDWSYQRVCFDAYTEHFGKDAMNQMILNGTLLKIKTKKDEGLWLPKELEGNEFPAEFLKPLKSLDFGVVWKLLSTKN
jgi:5'-3' exonuclease